MADQYISRRVEQAIRKANGDINVAQGLIQRLCDYDPELMKRLVTPYLPGIIAKTMSPTATPSRGQTRRAIPGPTARSARPQARRTARKPDISAEAFDAVVDQMAEHIGETKAPIGMTALIQPTVKSPCSPRHLEAVQTLVSAFNGR